ncbi:MAG: hypothetical protein AAFR61_22235 [Bacteroidota bacterium]
MNKRTSILFLLLGVIHLSMFAQPVRNLKEAGDNQKAINLGKAQLERDIAELAAMKNKIFGMETGFGGLKLAEVQSFQKELILDMSREVKQSEEKIAQAKREVAQSGAEQRSSAREVGRSRRDRVNRDGDLGEGRDLRDDRRDRNDDRRDARDDKMDLQQRIALASRQKQILNSFKAFNFSLEPSAKEKAVANIRLAKEFMEIMEKDIAATKRELAEDHAEKREDRRERGEDRREKRERRRND